jgi:3-deoxy-manno-octulosonate cytidylyltransferase (CMP-KDO synthetase)
MSKPIIVVPARLASTRLPDKPLAMIHGIPMIVHVWRRAIEAGVGRVVVAVDDPRVRSVVEDAGGHAVMTRPDHPSGTDRIHEAVEVIDPHGDHDIVVNLQGDLPTIAPAVVRAALTPLADPAVALSTLAAPITRAEERDDPNVVKMIGSALAPSRYRALYFTRATAPWGEGPLFHHIGLYAYRRETLRRFVALPPSDLEQREKLEQLRAIEAGMRIDVAIVDTVPFGVDTPHDLARATSLILA